jgi:hypothetical protein
MDEKIFEIKASEVTVEIIDSATGKLHRRTLPMDYYENANNIVLRGENFDGRPASLVFYSARGIERLKDMTGKGADHDDCNTY